MRHELSCLIGRGGTDASMECVAKNKGIHIDVGCMSHQYDATIYSTCTMLTQCLVFLEQDGSTILRFFIQIYFWEIKKKRERKKKGHTGVCLLNGV